MLEGCGPRTTQQLLKPVICSMPISANLYVGFRAHARCRPTTNRCRCRAAIVSMLIRIADRVPFEVEQINGAPSFCAISNSRDLCDAVTRAYRSTGSQPLIARSSIQRIPSGTRYYRQMAPGLINEIRECARLAPQQSS